MRRMGKLTGLHTCVSREDEASGHETPIPDKNNVPDGVEIFAINGPLFFGVADRFQSTLNAMETPPKVFIMYLHNMSAIDMTGIHALEEFLSADGKAVACYSPPCGNPSTGRPAGRYPAHRGKRTSSLTRRSVARAEEILEDTIMAGERVLLRAEFEILKLSRERSKTEEAPEATFTCRQGKILYREAEQHTSPKRQCEHEKLRWRAPLMGCSQ